MAQLIFSSSPAITFAGNTFINVPIILQFDETPLVSVVHEVSLGYTTEIPIYDADGTYLAKVRGTRVYATNEGQAAGVVIRQLPNLWVCTVSDRTVFEIHQQPGDAFRLQAELYTHSGHLIRVDNSPVPQLYDATGQALRVGGVTLIGNVFQDLRIGVLIGSDGAISIGVQ